MADHFTKQLGPILFARHNDYVMGRVPPSYSPCYQHFLTTVNEKLCTPKQKQVPVIPKDHPAAAAAVRLLASWSQVVNTLHPPILGHLYHLI